MKKIRCLLYLPMKRRRWKLSSTFILMVSLLSLPLPGSVFADQLGDAKAAYERGDYPAAYRLFKPLAEQGDLEAQHNLGGMYVKGEGVPQDYPEAVKWYRKAADQGYGVDQIALGALYADGLGVPKDYVIAHMWYNLAVTDSSEVERGEQAAKLRDSIASRMTPSQIVEAQKSAREWKPKK